MGQDLNELIWKDKGKAKTMFGSDQSPGWLTWHRRLHLHFTPESASWLSLMQSLDFAARFELAMAVPCGPILARVARAAAIGTCETVTGAN